MSLDINFCEQAFFEVIIRSLLIECLGLFALNIRRKTGRELSRFMVIPSS
jgi:hypothetical protein